MKYPGLYFQILIFKFFILHQVYSLTRGYKCHSEQQTTVQYGFVRTTTTVHTIDLWCLAKQSIQIDY